MRSRRRIPWHWGMLAVLVLGVGCAPRGGGAGGDGGIAGGSLDQIWLRYAGTSQFLQINRGNYCSTYKSFYEGAYATYSQDLASAEEDLADGLIDEGQYNLRICGVYRDYYGGYADLYSLAGTTTVQSSFTLQPLGNGDWGDDDDSAARGWDETQDSFEGTYAAGGEGPVSGDFDGTFTGYQYELGPGYLAGYRNIQCNESWTTASLNTGSMYEDLSYGSITGILSVSAVSETSYRLLLSDGQSTLYDYTDEGLASESPDTRTLTVDGAFDLCDVNVSTTTGSGGGDDDDDSADWAAR